MKKAVPGLSFFTLALISTQQRRSYPVCVEQMIRTEEEKAARQAKKEAKQAKAERPKRKPGRSKGSRNKNKTEVELNPELLRIQKMLTTLLNTVQGTLHLTYLVLDGHFGNHPALQMVRHCRLRLSPVSLLVSAVQRISAFQPRGPYTKKRKTCGDISDIPSR